MNAKFNAYVAKHQMVVHRACYTTRTQHSYLLGRVYQRLKDGASAEEVLAMIQTEIERERRSD